MSSQSFLDKMLLDGKSTKPAIKKYKNKEGTYFWAEKVGDPKGVAWHVVSQHPGYPATEAHDDWFGNQEDADLAAKECSEEETVK